jgi:hypothetical protein
LSGIHKNLFIKIFLKFESLHNWYLDVDTQRNRYELFEQAIDLFGNSHKLSLDENMSLTCVKSAYICRRAPFTINYYFRCVNNQKNAAIPQPDVDQHAETKLAVELLRDGTGFISLTDNCSDSCKRYQSLLKTGPCRDTHFTVVRGLKKPIVFLLACVKLALGVVLTSLIA